MTTQDYEHLASRHRPANPDSGQRMAAPSLASGTHAESLNASPAAVSLVQLRQSLDASPRVQVLQQISRELNRTATPARPLAAPPQQVPKPVLQAKGTAIDDDELPREALAGATSTQLRALAPPESRAPGAVVQRRLRIARRPYRDAQTVIAMFANDEDIGWDDRWEKPLNDLIGSDDDMKFDDLKELEDYLMGEIFPAVGVDQPSTTDDKVSGRLCFAYAALAAANATGHVPDAKIAEVKAELVKKNSTSYGGGASTAFRQMNLSPQQITIQDVDDKGGSRMLEGAEDAAGFIEAGLQDNFPLAAGVWWKKGRKTGNHWVYIVGTSGNLIHFRDQQNEHLLGTVYMGDDWEGYSADGEWTYKMTKVANAQDRKADIKDNAGAGSAAAHKSEDDKPDDKPADE